MSRKSSRFLHARSNRQGKERVRGPARHRPDRRRRDALARVPAPASLRARARVRPARLSPCPLQRQGSHRASLGQHRRRDARFRAGAARRRPGQRRLREHRPGGVREAQGRGRPQPDRERPRRGRVRRRHARSVPARAGARLGRLARRPRARRRHHRPGRHAAGGPNDGRAAPGFGVRVLGYDPALHARTRRGRSGR